MVLLRHRIHGAGVPGRRVYCDDVCDHCKLLVTLRHRDDVRARASDAELLLVAVVTACACQRQQARAVQMLRLGRSLSRGLGVSRFNRSG